MGNLHQLTNLDTAGNRRAEDRVVFEHFESDEEFQWKTESSVHFQL